MAHSQQVKKEHFFLGKHLPMDLFALFADLNGHTCCLCRGTTMFAMGDAPEDIFGMDVFAATIVDVAGRPVGLACWDCVESFTEFNYTDKEQKA